MGARTLQQAEGAEFLTVGQAAQLVQVSASTVRAWCRNGRLRRYGAGKLVRVRRAEVLEALTVSAGAPANVDAEAAALLARHRR